MADKRNSKNNKLVSGTSDGDSIINSGSTVTIDAGAGNDTIANDHASDVTIFGGDGDDSIYNYYSNRSSIAAGAGNDTVLNSGVLVTVDAGEGSDIVANYSGASLAVIDLGSGNDSINNSAAASSLNAGAGNDTVINFGSSMTIKGGDGDDYLSNNSAASLTVLDGGAGNDTVVNRADFVTVHTGDGDDSVYNYGDNVFINVDGGSARIYNTGSDVTVSGSDTSELVSIAGYNTAPVTVQLGGGNDTFIAGYKSSELIQFSGGALDIANYNYDDTIELLNGSVASYTTNGGDLILDISDGSRITLESMTNHAITIRDADGNTSTEIYSNGYSPLAALKNFVSSINRSKISNSSTKFDEAIKACSDFDSMQDAIDQMIVDCASAGSAEKFLKDYCGIILENDDVGAITGWDAGGLSAKTATNIMPETTPAATLDSLTNATYTRGGLTIVYPQNESTLNSDEKKILQNAYRWWIDEALELITESFGFAFDNDVVSLSAIDSSSTTYWGATYGNSKSNAISLNAYYTAFVDDDDQDGNGIDRCLSHELTHVMQNIFLVKFPQFLHEGMAELTGGIDDQRTQRISLVAGNADSLETYLNLNNSSTGNANYYAAGYMFWRYLAKQASDSYDSLKGYAWSENATLDGTSDGELLTASGKGLTVNAGAGNDTITAYGQDEVILSGKGDDSILLSSIASGMRVEAGAGNDRIFNYSSGATVEGNDGNDLISNYVSSTQALLLGGAGADSIFNGAANVTIDGGEGDDYIDAYSNGADVIIYSAGGGNDLIANFYGDDTLMIAAGKIASQGAVGDDYVVSVAGEGAITLVGAASRVTSANIVGESESEVNAIINSADAVKVVGSSDADSIVNYGSNVTIDGGTGNDTFVGSEHGEMYLFSSAYGDNVITNFGVGDSISMISGTQMSGLAYGDDYVVTLKGRKFSGTVTLESASGYNFKRSGNILTVDKEKNTVINSADAVKVVGSSDADSIVNYGSNVTIDGGTGNDTFVGSEHGEMYLFSSAYGDNVITNFGVGDSISMISGTQMSGLAYGDDYVVTLKGRKFSGTVTLEGAGGYNFKRSGKVLTVESVENYWFTDDEPLVDGNSLETIIQSDAVPAALNEPLINPLDNLIASSTVGIEHFARRHAKK